MQGRPANRARRGIRSADLTTEGDDLAQVNTAWAEGEVYFMYDIRKRKEGNKGR